jgi:hypothetical protein
LIVAAVAEIELQPIAIDPRRCGLCGLKIDRHELVDVGDGPEFFCHPDDDIVKQWELADPRDSWRHMGESPPALRVRNSDVAEMPTPRPHYRTPQATTDAFWFVVDLCDPARLKTWLHDHPRDARHLLKLLESK